MIKVHGDFIRVRAQLMNDWIVQGDLRVHLCPHQCRAQRVSFELVCGDCGHLHWSPAAVVTCACVWHGGFEMPTFLSCGGSLLVL